MERKEPNQKSKNKINVVILTNHRTLTDIVKIFEPAHKILLLIACSLICSVNMHGQLPSGTALKLAGAFIYTHSFTNKL